VRGGSAVRDCGVLKQKIEQNSLVIENDIDRFEYSQATAALIHHRPLLHQDQ
jgi:hypothetical protein